MPDAPQTTARTRPFPAGISADDFRKAAAVLRAAYEFADQENLSRDARERVAQVLDALGQETDRG